MLQGVRFFARGVRTHSVILDGRVGKMRMIDTQHFEELANPPVVRL
jgi:fructose-1,6-bisphosphatase/sedoheptulose 1,7-bisphosphatase-like protein